MTCPTEASGQRLASARRNDGIARLFGVTMLAATLTALAVALWR